MNTENKLLQIAISLGLGLLTWGALIFLHNITSSISTLERVFSLLGGTPESIIQFVSYVAFYFGLIQMYFLHKDIKNESKAFELNLLPAEDQLVLTPTEVMELKLGIIDMEKKGIKYKVADFIKKTCTQYRNDNSVTDTLQVLDVHIGNNKEYMEGNLSMVRYIIGAIMSLGFIGTLIGLSSAIGQAHLAKTDEGMPILTGYLNVAFDTTLLALILGLILNYFYHRYIEDLDKFFANSKTYIVDNLISRIYAPAVK